MKGVKVEEKSLTVYVAKLKKLRIHEVLLVLLEIIAMGVCTIYVFMSTFSSNEKICFWNITPSMIELVVFMLSVIMALINSESTRKKKNIVKDYLSALNDESPSEIVNGYKIKAEQLISPLDIYKDNIKRGKRVTLHNKREVIRSYILFIGALVMVSVAVIILFICNLNFPILLAWESLILYFFIMLDFFAYQIIVNKSGSNVFSDRHKSKISFDKVKRLEDMRYLQKILYMHRDRYENYLLTLKISTITTNILSIIITIIIEGDNEKIKYWFGLKDSPKIIPVIFAITTIILYVISLIFGNIMDKKINDMGVYISASYNKKNYESLKRKFPDLLEYKNILDGHSLDIARGTYEYNVEIINDREKRTINYTHIFRVKQRIVNNIPRVKLTSGIAFIFSASILVWYKMNIFNMVYVCIITFIAFLSAYFGMVFYNRIKFNDWEAFVNQEK